MKKTNTNKGLKKLIPAAGMLMLSAAMLGTSTFAWFTMNKEVSVTGMEVKAHAEEGLLINEVAAYNDGNWDDQATGNTTPTTVVMRPASTLNLATWWHANSKLSYDEAGIENLSGTVDIDDSGNKYTNITVGETGVLDAEVVSAAQATGGEKAETHVIYKDASFGDTTTSGTMQDGEGFYVKYTYYLKSSGDADLSVSNLQVQVKATKNTTGTNASGSSDDLDPCLRVGVTMNTTADGNTSAGYKIFSPIPGTGASGTAGATNTSYSVTTNEAGSSTDTVTPVVASATGTFTEYTQLNTSNIIIPNVNSDGIPVYVYVWFEGEDTHCMSDNLTSALAAYDIDINFQDADIF